MDAGFCVRSFGRWYIAGPLWHFYFHCFCFGVIMRVLFFILAIKRKPIQYSKDIGIIKGLAQGFRFVFRNQLILAVLSLDLFAVLFGVQKPYCL